MANANFSSADIRNVALVGHGSCGKTALAEAILFDTGATSRLGVTVDGTSTLDFEPEEQKRGGSIATSFAWVVHEDKKVNLLDTPGDGNFIFDALTALQGADAAVVVVSAPDGVEVQTERVFNAAMNLGLPRVVVVNKMDRERADADAVLAELGETWGDQKFVPLQVPIGLEADFSGVVSLLQRKALNYGGDGSGKFEKTDVPADLSDEVEAAWEALVENVAETDEELLEQYLETFELSQEQVRDALRTAVASGELVPVLFTAAAPNIGAQAVLDIITWAFPSPVERPAFSGVDGTGDPTEIDASASGPFIAQVIHTFMDEFSGKQSIMRVLSGNAPSDGGVDNLRSGQHERLGAMYSLRGTDRTPVDTAVTGDIVAVAKLKDTSTNDTLAAGTDVSAAPAVYPPPMFSYAIHVSGKGDEDKLKGAIERLIDEDPTLSLSYDELSHKMVLQGMGQQHLDMSIAKMARKFKVAVETDLPAVPYKETIKRKVTNIEGKHKKQTGGAGQFGVAYIDVEPLAKGGSFEFVDKIFGGSIPKQLIPSVEKGVRARMNNGFLAGYPIVDLRVTLTDGKYHPVDSKDVAFQMAGSKGLKAAFEKGGTKLLEPVYKLSVIVPTDAMGDIMGDITSRRGRIQGMNPTGKKTTIEAIVPLAEIQRYAPDLRAMTGGQGTFTMEFEGYEDLPGNLYDKVVAASPFRKDDDED